ncbi:MAG: chromosomal replication initiator protein DnaA [Planctomycetales bacterium]|nr:chromosomal replication initiator protein DnaA [Planctomycetales bacterium]
MQPASLVAKLPGDLSCNPDAATELIRLELASEIGAKQFDQWFTSQARLRVAADELIVEAVSPFLIQWLQKKFSPALRQAARIVLGDAVRLRFAVAAAVISPVVVGDSPTPQLRKSSSQPTPAATKPEQAATVIAVRPKSAMTTASFGEAAVAKSAMPGRRFADLQDFVSGPGNELAVTAVGQVCRSPGTQLNPLCIHGGVGTGKSHLLEGIYRQVRRLHPQLQVVYLTAENFANYFTSALREHTLPSFRQRFRSIDVLLIDDVHFLDAKFGIQEEFLHTIKQLDRQGKQLVVTADRHPRLLTKLNEELKTRFLAGMVCRLDAPDFATRREVVSRKAARMDADFATESLTFVAERFTQNVRELEGALNCLQTYHAMTGQRITASVARNVLADLERDCIRVVRLTDIELAVTTLFGLATDDLRSDNRSRSVSQPRMLAMYLARKHTRSAYAEIGHYFGGRNHSTAIAAERKIAQEMERQTSIQIASQTWSMRDVLETLDQQLHAC